MSSRPKTAEEKRARLAELKAQQNSDGNSAASAPSGGNLSSAASRATVKLQIISQPHTIDRATYFDARITEVTDSGVEGKRMLMLPSTPGSDFAIAPLTDERGDYLYKFDSSYNKTDERKPVQLAEFGCTTVKISGAPNGPVDWATPPALFPGREITIEGAAVSSVFKQGTLLSGSFASALVADEGESKKPLDLEIPKLAFGLVANDEDLVRRNMALSLDTGGVATGWQNSEATSPTKQFAVTTLSNHRSELLKPGGSFLKGLDASGAQGDADWKAGMQQVSKKVTDGAPFQSSGFGFSFDVAANGPTLVMPIYALGTESELTERMPGYEGKAMDGEQADVYFEGVLSSPGGRPVFVSSFKAGTSRASGGPWLNLNILGFAKAAGAKELVQLLSPLNFKMSLPAMPVHVGSKHIDTIKVIASSFFPLTDMVVAFNTDRNNVFSNPKANESWDCRIPTIDFHSALLKFGIELDLDMALELFHGKPINMDPADVASTLTSSPKPLLACGFTLLNENMEARNADWLDQQVNQMEKILAFANRKAECTIEIRAVNPKGFEEHKASLKAFEDLDLVDRVAKVGVDWPIYAVIKIDDEPAAPPVAAPAVASNGPAAKRQKK